MGHGRRCGGLHERANGERGQEDWDSESLMVIHSLGTDSGLAGRNTPAALESYITPTMALAQCLNLPVTMPRSSFISDPSKAVLTTGTVDVMVLYILETSRA